MSVGLENTRTVVLLRKVKSSSVSLPIFKWDHIRAVVKSYVLVLELQDLLLEQKL